jgi:hypothetical protein
VSDPRSTDEIRAESLEGPWEAVIADGHGWVLDIQDLREDPDEDPTDCQIVIVRRTAAPTAPDADYMSRLPGAINPEDRAYEQRDFDDMDDIEFCWARAEAMAAGLNAAAGGAQ